VGSFGVLTETRLAGVAMENRVLLANSTETAELTMMNFSSRPDLTLVAVAPAELLLTMRAGGARFLAVAALITFNTLNGRRFRIRRTTVSCDVASMTGVINVATGEVEVRTSLFVVLACLFRVIFLFLCRLAEHRISVFFHHQFLAFPVPFRHRQRFIITYRSKLLS